MKRAPKKPKRPPKKKSTRSAKPKRSPDVVESAAVSLAVPAAEIRQIVIPIEVPQEIIEAPAEIVELHVEAIVVQEETVLVREEPVEVHDEPIVKREEIVELPAETAEVHEETAVAREETLEVPAETAEVPEPTIPVPEEPPQVLEEVAEHVEPVAAREETVEARQETIEPVSPIVTPPVTPDDATPIAYSPDNEPEIQIIAIPTELTEQYDENPPATAVNETVELQDEIDQYLDAVDVRKRAETPKLPLAPSPKKEQAKPPPKPSDRRTHPRYAFLAEIQVFAVDSGARITSTVRDLSERGCYANTPAPFPLGTIADVRITKAPKTFAACARVVYNDPGKGMGLMFTNFDAPERATLDAWISESRETSWLAVNRRRSQRVMMKLPVRIATAETSGKQWQEETYTVAVSAHGALLVLKEPVSRGQRLTLTNVSTKAAIECLVAHIDKPSSAPLQVGVEFLLADPSFWRVAFPPKDWTPRHPDAKSK